jgi:acetylornithine deacetylase
MSRRLPAMNDALLSGTLDLLETLVGFDTRSSLSNLELIRFIEAYLDRFGVRSTLSLDAECRKANLYATIGPDDRSGLCFSGHTDVVPADGQPWTVPAFALTRAEDRVLGRGTADMKGFIACVLASVPAFVRHCTQLPIHLAFSYDEEVGCVGVRSLLKELEAKPHKPLACIIGEPTLMQVAVAHKGKRAYRCCVKGLAGHSALTHRGVNAVDFAAELVTYLRRTGRLLASEGLSDVRFEPPYTTIHTGSIRGGIALNVIPDRAEVQFEIRNVPGEDVDRIVDTIRNFTTLELTPEMQRVHHGAGFAWSELISYPALADQPQGGSLQRFACGLAGNSEKIALAFGTEGGLFQAIGIPSVVCGPGSIEQGHKADEYVTIDQLRRCLGFLAGAAIRLQESSPLTATAT